MQNAENMMSHDLKALDCGDERLHTRAVIIGQTMCERPAQSINQASKGKAWSKAAYRFFDNSKVDSEEIMESHVVSTINRIKEHNVKHVIAAIDTMFLSYDSHSAMKGLGGNA